MLAETETAVDEGDEKPSPPDGSEVYYAISDYAAAEETQISLKERDEVEVLEKMSKDWWWASVNDSIGYVPANHLSKNDPLEEGDSWQDDEYFSNYATLKLQLEMLSDKHRTLAYKSAIENAKTFIQNKVVVDLGCGTGILSMFCAKLGGAKQVYAVEASEMAEQATQLVEHNDLSDVVKVMHCRAEELEIPDKVDLIVSEWMGTLLLFELMLESVLLTRDKCLKDNGVMWPSEAELYLVPCTAPEYYGEKVAFWSDVYGFDFSPLIPLAQSEMLGRPIHNYILPHGDCLSSPVTIMRLALKTLQLQDIETTESSFKCTVTIPGTFHGFGSWFEVKFGDIPAEYDYQPVTLSTSPQHPLTHWKQDLLMVDTPLTVKPDDIIEGRIKIARNQHWRRHLKVLLTYRHISGEQSSQEFRKEYVLWR